MGNIAARKYRPIGEVYRRWIADPENGTQEMAETVERIVRNNVKNPAAGGIPYEEKEDVIATLRVVCWKCLQKIEQPTSQRIYNFLNTATKNAILQHSRNTIKRKGRESIFSDVPETRYCSIPLPLTFDDPLDASVAKMLSEGYTQREILSTLSIGRKGLADSINNIRAALA